MVRLGRLLAFARPYRALFGAGLLAAVVASALDGLSFALLIPFLRLLFGAASGIPDIPTGVERLLAQALGGLLAADRGTALRHVALVLVGVVALKNAAAYVAGVLGERVQEGLARDLRTALYRQLQSLGLSFFHGIKGGQLLSRLVADVDVAKGIVSAALVSALQSVALVVVFVAILWSLSWQLTLVTLTVAPLIVLTLRPLLRRVRERTRTALDERGEVAAIVDETIEGARVVKAHGAEAYERQRFTDAVDRYMRAVLRGRQTALLASPVSETLGAAVIVVLLVVGAAAVGSQSLRPEVFVAFVALSLRLLSPIKALSQFPAVAEQALAAADRAFEILDRAPDDVDPPGAREFPGLHRCIEFEDVWVSYDGETSVLRGVSLTVRRGEVVALVGPSGAGKSTLVDLLPRFVAPSSGRVLIDGVPVESYGRRSLRRALGIVSQHTVIFNDTVRNNIAYGDQSGASDEAVVAAARAARAHAFIERLPHGYDTVLGERGMRLSGGERQRIAIARALLRDPPILILDEATSNLDAESERLVQAAIARLLEGRTVLVIAHRLSTVVRADRIVVLEGGRVVEEGSHDTLVRRDGLYARLHRLELAGR